LIEFIKALLQKPLWFYERRTVGDVLIYAVLWSVSSYAITGKFSAYRYLVLVALTFLGYWVLSFFEKK